MVLNRHLLCAVGLFCAGAVFQFQGAFGDPYLQQIAILVTWLPVALVLLREYYYSYADSALTEGRPPVEGNISAGYALSATVAARRPCPPAPAPTASCAATPTPALGSTPDEG